jgi:hypothetical protein
VPNKVMALPADRHSALRQPASPSAPFAASAEALQIVRSPRLVAQQQQIARVFGPQPGGRQATRPPVQRLVPPGLKPGTAVIIVRSTSQDLHLAPAQVCGPGERPNEYLVEVAASKEKVYARADQLKLPSDADPVAAPSNVDLSFLQGRSVDEVLDLVAQAVSRQLPKAKPFIIGGSFASFLQAVKAGQSARTPRDIDILVPSKVWKTEFGGKPSTGEPVRTGESFQGLPLEIHEIGSHVKEADLKGHVDASARGVNMLDKDLLLTKTFVKLVSLSDVFGEVIKFDLSAQANLQVMVKANDTIMENKHLSKGTKAIWIKAMADIETLVLSGAKLIPGTVVGADDW